MQDPWARMGNSEWTIIQRIATPLWANLDFDLGAKIDNVVDRAGFHLRSLYICDTPQYRDNIKQLNNHRHESFIHVEKPDRRDQQGSSGEVPRYYTVST